MSRPSSAPPILPQPPTQYSQDYMQQIIGMLNSYMQNMPAQPFAPSGSAASMGYVPSPGTTPGTTRFLCEDGTFKTP